jgi:hypothetical protein
MGKCYHQSGESHSFSEREVKLKTSLVEIVAKRLKVDFYDILWREVTILPCASLSTQALSKLGLLKQQQYLLGERGRILFRPEPCHAVFDQLAAGRRPSTDDRFTYAQAST